ncbi:MAG: hypothetical protein HY912_06930 [Desulfomonile tiedjei]|uniref:Uncharacterized protein n=1 Tax=Desulfomonile tiedjei TaxID=2358 RepID=A0A9D6Z5J0_9BACT|nr:hypothetical protein [Desulfomonile tiedjei]
MFLSKLLVRIRGELLNLKEELARKDDPGEKTETLLETVHTGTESQPHSQETSPEKSVDLERKFDELLKHKKEEQSTSDQPPANPRTLG